MCTLSYQVTESGYRLCFSRDEKRNRKPAHPPQVFGHALMPIDGDKNGTWISVNQHGLSLCLLNNYQCQHQPADPKSRGEIIKKLSQVSSTKELMAAFNLLDIKDYPGFTLVVFSPESTPYCLTANNGNIKKNTVTEWPLTSSSFGEQACSTRRHYYQDIKGIEFHRSHYPSAGPLSVCVHREDVQTVSLTEIVVEPEMIEMHYFDGSPCENHLALNYSLERLQHELA
ncbi:MAG: hypothetical protein ACI93R_002895 [Flavobacteriales bacterium]|jgi:hypothetical protein